MNIQDHFVFGNKFKDENAEEWTFLKEFIHDEFSEYKFMDKTGHTSRFIFNVELEKGELDLGNFELTGITFEYFKKLYEREGGMDVYTFLKDEYRSACVVFNDNRWYLELAKERGWIKEERTFSGQPANGDQNELEKKLNEEPEEQGFTEDKALNLRIDKLKVKTGDLEKRIHNLEYPNKFNQRQ